MFCDLCPVLKVFKSFNPQTIIILMLFAIGIKLGYFIYPPTVTIGNDEWGFEWMMKGIQQIFGDSSYLMVFFGILNLVVQSLVVNRLATEYKLFNSDSFVPAALFLLISSLIPAWNIMSAPLMANWFILFVINNLLRYPFTSTPNKLLFNTGMFTSIAALIYYPTILFLIFIIWAILILQSFKFKDLLILLLGFSTPLYFLASFCYLFDIPYQHFILKTVSFQSIQNLKIFPSKIWLAIGIISSIGLVSMYFLNNLLNKHVEAGKKMWWIIILSIIIGTTVAIFNVNNDGAFWYFSIAPVALLSTNIWIADTNKWLKIGIFWLLIAAVIFIQYF